MREVDLGFDLVAILPRNTACSGACLCLSFAARPEMSTNFFRLVFLNGAGVGLLFRHTHFRQYIQNGFTLNFQLPGQIVDSNLTHPPLFSSTLPLSLHSNLRQSVFVTLAHSYTLRGQH
jgi:hypothetical protein